MAFDQTTRNRLARFVSDARALLTEEFTRQLQNEYGLDPASGDLTPIERLTALDDRQRETARILRETLDYYLAGNSKVDGKTNRDVLDRIVREQAFTVLNRLCALRMSEARGLVLESIVKGYQSKGFQLYARLAGSALGETGEAYHMYLFSLMDEFAVDLPVLFDRFSAQGRLFPRESALLKLLELINDPEIEPLWAEDETIGWIYQYFNSREERKAMRDASQAPRNGRELAVRNQFFTPRYVVEFLTDNTLGRIWYEMTRGETVLKDTCRYQVRRKHSFFLEEGQEAPEPFLTEQRHETDPDLAHEMWLPPNEEITDLNTIFLYGLTAGGYDYAREQWGIECGDLANEKLKKYHEAGKWEGTFDELRCCLFFEQRRYHHFGEGPEGDDAKAILDLYQAICERWSLEVEYIPHRLLKDPREIKMLDPACGSMHFGLYAFDLYEQIYAEAWELEERLGEDALKRLADLDSLHKTYPDQESYLKDVPRLIIEFNIHGVDIDPRAVQIAGLSLWLRAQKSWQAQGLRSSERPQIHRSNVVCAEPMPGDRQMLEEFLTTLRGDGLEALMRKAWHVPADQKVRATPQMADSLAKLVRTVWDEMELAGEAGSLLKIEETLRDTIDTARKEAEEKSPLFRVLEYGFNDPPKEKYVQVVAGEDQDFFDRAEGLVLTALKDYAERAVNGASFRRSLFTGEAIEGFAFIDLCRKRYDVVLMNPPFGDATKLQVKVLEKYYPYSKSDLAACFLEAMKNRALYSGKLGAITARNIYYLSSFELFRRKIILQDSRLICFVDLGGGVLDAMVSTALIILDNIETDHQYPVVNLNINSYENKGAVIEDIIARNTANKQLILRSPNHFTNLPSASFSYWASESIVKLLSAKNSLDNASIQLAVGLQSGDDFRFFRLVWEIDPSNIGKNNKWSYITKGGEYSKFWDDIHLVVNWSKKGGELKSSPDCFVRNESLYFSEGLTYPFRTAKGFNVRCLPKDCIFTLQGMAIFPPSENKTYSYFILGLLNSSISLHLLRMITSSDAYQVGYVKRLPCNINDQLIIDRIAELSAIAVETRISLDRWDETTRSFNKPQLAEPNTSLVESIKSSLEIFTQKISEIPKFVQEISKYVVLGFGINDEEINEFIEGFHEPEFIVPPSPYDYCTGLLSYLFGACVGRWDIRYATIQKSINDFSDPFASLPACPPGMLQNTQGMPASPGDVPVDYPLRITWSSVQVDDEGHPEDVEARMREALRVIWGERTDAIEAEACQILGVRSLREYFRKPTWFFVDHLKRYSKSRRVAPIYWPLSTVSCSYTLWLYFHRLKDQTLYTCVNDFVDPKLKQVSEEAARLRLKKGRSAADEKELERLTDFERELKDFREELLRVAKFWKPNLNDGVEITAAPLWKLFQHKPWQKRLKETWQKLEAGEYDWAHLAYSIWPERVREKCKNDKSLAIAHDLEELYVEPPASAKKKKANKTVVDEETEGWFNDD